MERVSIREGKIPAIIVAPHGFDGDDENTGLIAEIIAKTINCYAVINRTWEREEFVDFMLDKADCNNVTHCHADVVKEEFLDPIIRFKNRILRTNSNVNIFYIHGMNNRHRIYSENPNLDLILGYGAGTPDSFSCKLETKNLMLHLLNELVNINSYEGASGGFMSGWSRNNMNQLFKKHYPDHRVESMQLEIIYELRKNKDSAIKVAESLSKCISNMLMWKYEELNKFKTYGSY